MSIDKKRRDFDEKCTLKFVKKKFMSSTSVSRCDTDAYVVLLRTHGFHNVVQRLIDICVSALRIDKSKITKEKLRVYLTLIKGDANQSRTAIDSFKKYASDYLSDVMDDKEGNLAIVHSDGMFAHESTKSDEQSRQLATSLQNSVEFMDLLQLELDKNGQRP